MNSWNEAGRVWEDDRGMLDENQVAQCERADVAEPLRSPIPTRMISNGEYMPVPQTDQQKQVEARIEELAATASDKLGPSRGGDGRLIAAREGSVGRFFQGELGGDVSTAPLRGRRAAQGPVRVRRPTPFCP